MTKEVKRNNWKTRGVIFNNDFEEWYLRYINSKECEKCNEPYKNSKDKCMDHNHKTGEPRNILCDTCNKWTDRTIHKNNNSGELYIYKINNNKLKQLYYYSLEIKRNKNILIRKSSIYLEKLIKIRDTFILENPQYF
tara:strand:+ start:60 stop:470 length:411 start_codon:yes stop_codon:yes gene_type:complete